MTLLNEFGQPIGPLLPADWTAPPAPARQVLAGRSVTLEPLGEQHGPGLWQSFRAAPDSLWTYLSIGPFVDELAMSNEMTQLASREGWCSYAVCVDGCAVGFSCYLRIDPPSGVLEIGSIAFSQQLQRTSAATEALYLMIDHAFELGYRRCEWKCDDLNAPSRAAALRLGFTFEGTFRSATHYKGRSRDTAWYAIVKDDWPGIRSVFERWLSPDNFDGSGSQRSPLRSH